MKFAAILGAAAVLTAGAASAAEIGVRHTWGNTDRHINHGRSTYERTVTGSYSEDSQGFALGVKANEFKVTEKSVTDGSGGGGFSADVDLATVGTIVAPFFSPTSFVNLDPTGTISGGGGFGFESETVDTIKVDGKLNVAGSSFTRSESGRIRETATETYNFGGSSSSGFSELSTFSR